MILHLRARRLTVVAPILLLLAAMNTVAEQWIPTSQDGVSVFGVTTASTLIAVLLLAVTLAGADVGHERSLPRLNVWFRSLHIGSALALIAGVATLTFASGTVGPLSLTRNVLGLSGLVLLAAAILPTSLTWTSVVAYTAAVYFWDPGPGVPGSSWWAWFLQSDGSTPAARTALILVSAGVATYVQRGPASEDACRG
jgi:hypothetical protein